METHDVIERARKLTAEQFEADPAAITNDTRFVDDLGADSLDLVELTMLMEEEFDVEIPDDEAESFKTFGDAVKWLEAKVGAPA